MQPLLTQRTNGVDLERLQATVAAIQKTPSLAAFQFRSHTDWLGGAHCRTEIQGFFGAGAEDASRARPLSLEGDEPPLLLGENRAPNAVEAVLHALAACLTVGFVYNAAARGIRVDALSFDVEGELDLQGFLGLSDRVRPGFQSIRVRYRAQTDAPRAQVEELCAYVQRTSPVLDLLRYPVPVTVSLQA